MTYKVGDKVRILHTDYSKYGLEVGAVHSVARVNQAGVDLRGSDGVRFYFYNSEVEPYTERTVEPERTLSGTTIDQIAIDSMKWHMKDDDMEPLQKEAFRIVMRYYGVSV